jgi:hypothetical protein
LVIITIIYRNSNIPMSRLSPSSRVPAAALAITLLGLFLAPWLPCACADTVITYREKLPGGSAGPKETITITKGRAILERSSEPGQVLIFEENPTALIHIDHDLRSFLRLDRQRLEEMRESIRVLLGRAYLSVEDFVSTLPPDEQHAAREHLLKKVDQLKPPEQLQAKENAVRYEDTGETTKIGLHHCKVFLGWEGDRKTSELFMTEREALRLPPEDHHTLQVFTDYLEKIASSLPGEARLRATSRLALPQMDSSLFPVMITNLWHDGTSTTILLRAIDQIEVDPQRLEIPAGYKPVQSGPQMSSLP